MTHENNKQLSQQNIRLKLAHLFQKKKKRGGDKITLHNNIPNIKHHEQKHNKKFLSKNVLCPLKRKPQNKKRQTETPQQETIYKEIQKKDVNTRQSYRIYIYTLLKLTQTRVQRDTDKNDLPHKLTYKKKRDKHFIPKSALKDIKRLTKLA